ncbi:hypothetical protein [Trueperella pyogenes]|uniref:hypothetical protein n=1 Tax=Trueperella pyogenes TaxID=1661 RepID=UPI0032503EC3
MIIGASAAMPSARPQQEFLAGLGSSYGGHLWDDFAPMLVYTNIGAKSSHGYSNLDKRLVTILLAWLPWWYKFHLGLLLTEARPKASIAMS